MESHSAVPKLEQSVHRWRRTVYLLAAGGVGVFAALRPDWRAVVTVLVFLLGSGLGASRFGVRSLWLLLWDLGVSAALWWLYGPVSGAAFVALGVVALGPFLLDRREARLILAAALVAVPVTVFFHFAATEIDLPLFHPHDPVTSAEFLLTGAAIQAVLLAGVGALMMRIAEILRRGQAALVADLDRQRELNTLKDGFIATVSHELRTPLTSLKGFTRTLLESDPDPEERREFLTIMSDQAEELHALIEDLITFSRLGAGALQVDRRAVDLAHLVDEVLSGFGKRGAGVSNRVPPLTMVSVDPPRLRQVLRNLIDNALKYGALPIAVSARVDERVVRCAVLDSGQGVNPDEESVVFQPYARLVEDRTMSSPGIGLGLPIVRRLVEAHQGSVRIVTRNGMHGFEFTLPAHADLEVSGTPSHPMASSA